MSDITREQYDNAVRIRENGWRCGVNDPPCRKCAGYEEDCGRQGDGLREEFLTNIITTYEAAHPEEFRASPDPGEGWRYLKIGEVLEPTDEVYDSDELGWVKTCYRDSVYQNELLTYRRRLAKPPRIYDYRDVELPEVQALIGLDVMASDNIYSLVTGLHDRMRLRAISQDDPNPFKGSNGISSRQFIRAIDEPPKIKLTQAELIAIAATSRGVKPEQIVVEE